MVDDLGNTPVLEEIKWKHGKMVFFFLKKGVKWMRGDVAPFLLLVVANGDVQYARWLLDIWMDPNLQDKDKNSPLHVVVKGLSCNDGVVGESKNHLLSSFR